MEALLPLFIGFTNGANPNTRYVSLASSIILNFNKQLLASSNIFLGPVANNYTKYSSIIDLLYVAISLGISHLVVYLDSYLVIS